MKRIQLLLFFSAISIFSFSQNKHIVFNGISLGVGYKNMVSELHAKGFEGEYILKGMFLFKDSEIIINHDKNEISSIDVQIPVEANWTKIKDLYLHIKDLLIEKYNKSSIGQVVEKFDNGYKEGDGKELKALENCDLVYRTVFDVYGGTIWLSITCIQNEYLVSLNYTDTLNTDKFLNNYKEDEKKQL